MYWETNFHPPRYRVQDDAIHSCGLEKAKFFRMKTKKNTGVTTSRFTSWTKEKTVKNSKKTMWIICNPLLWRFFFGQTINQIFAGFQVIFWHFQVSWVMGSFFCLSVLYNFVRYTFEYFIETSPLDWLLILQRLDKESRKKKMISRHLKRDATPMKQHGFACYLLI